MTTTLPATQRYSLADLADALFASPLQKSEDPSDTQVRDAIEKSLASCGGCTGCAACVAAEAGEHPETYLKRIRWAFALAERVFGAHAELFERGRTTVAMSRANRDQLLPDIEARLA